MRRQHLAGHLIDVLTGKETERTERFGHAQMPVFGAGSDLPVKTWQSVYRQLLAAGLITVDHEAYGALKLMPEARAVFRKERPVRFRVDRPTRVPRTYSCCTIRTSRLSRQL